MLYHYNEAERADSILYYAEELIGMYMMIMIHITLHNIMHGKCTRDSLNNIISIQISAQIFVGMHVNM